MASIEQPFSQSFNPVLFCYLLIFFIVFVCFHHVLARSKPSQKAPNEWKTFDRPILGSALQFYSKRRDMISQGSKAFHSGNFSFYVGKKHIVSLNSPAGRQTFYETKELSLAAGFVELLAGIPSLGEPAKEESWARYFNKTLLLLTRRENLTLKLATWSNDIRATCKELASRSPASTNNEWQVLNPFEDVYELVYKLTTRSVGSTEIAEDRKLLRWSLSIFESFERSSSTAAFIFPWLITPDRIARVILGIKFYTRMLRLIWERKRSGKLYDDALRHLLDEGTSPADIIKFQISALWAGVLTTGAIGSWMPILLASNSTWKRKCKEEVDGVIKKYKKDSKFSSDDILQSLDIEVWESEFSIIYSCVREAIRLCMPGTVFRKNNSGRDVAIVDTEEVIPSGSFAACLVDNVHMNPKFYPEPLKFNPGRYIGEVAVQKNGPHTYVGWGSGRHPCIGAKVAKLEITMIMAYLLTHLEFELSDRDGNPVVEPPPLPDRNGHKAQKETKPIFLRYKSHTQ